MEFRNVTTFNGRLVDARLAVTGTTGGYEYVGLIPHFNGPITGDSNYGYPDNRLESDKGNDLGIYYRSFPIDPQTQSEAVENPGSLTWTLSFYDGDGSFSDLVTLDSIALLLYDHDGEQGQSESIRANLADGLAGYSLHNASGIQPAAENGSFRFDASGTRKPELTAEGGFILHYRNVSQLTIEQLALTQPTLPNKDNGIFLALDGDLGLVNPSDFGAYQAVPEPSAVFLLAASSLLVLRRKR